MTVYIKPIIIHSILKLPVDPRDDNERLGAASGLLTQPMLEPSLEADLRTFGASLFAALPR
jgi:hypothetical protein